jgi:hypothetical protein
MATVTGVALFTPDKACLVFIAGRIHGLYYFRLFAVCNPLQPYFYYAGPRPENFRKIRKIISSASKQELAFNDFRIRFAHTIYRSPAQCYFFPQAQVRNSFRAGLYFTAPYCLIPFRYRTGHIPRQRAFERFFRDCFFKNAFR